jgi:hypothetical protein
MTAAAVDYWRRRLEDVAAHEERVVLWGSGSKGVAFLTLLGRESQIPYVVDINPYRHRTYMPCTGQEIIPPEFLRAWRPDVVIVMNPAYRDEIRTDLGRLGLAPEILAV